MHLAALPGVRAGHPLPELWRHNAVATERLAGALRPGQRLVLASTSSVYGDARRLPVAEDSPPSPLNPYATTKLAAEGLARRAAGPGATVVVCRLFTVFGEGQRPDMAFARWIEAIADGRPVTWCAPRGARREFTYVGDAVGGLIAALERGRAGEVYNVAGSGSTPVDAALREIEDIVGRRARLVKRPAFSEAVATAANGEKALAELGYAPRVGLRAGLERQVEATLAPAAVPLAAA
jgi:nucleoside-diphosphate-sugar epimerase